MSRPTAVQPSRIALVGAHGFGASYLPRIADLAAAGLAELCAVADPRPPEAGDGIPPHARRYTSLDELLAREETSPDVVVLATPLPTHLPLAEQAMRAGSDVMLEKPPAISLAEHARLVAIARGTGRRCQVGFQTFGSNVFAEIDRIVASGEIGEVTAIGAVGTWVRTAGYWARAPWAGRRRMDGLDVVDGVVTNPLAHAVATALRVGGVTRAEDVESVETELFRANAIEADDTSSVRVVARDGRSFGFGLTLCAPEHLPARILVQGTHGELDLFYETDRIVVRTPAGQWSRVSDRTDLLADLLAVRGDPSATLRCDVQDTGAFMRVLDAVRAAPEPVPIASSFVTWHGDGAQRRPVVADVELWCERAARTATTFGALGAPFAAPADLIASGDQRDSSSSW